MINERKNKAKEFAEYWEGKGNEKSESQLFWTSFLCDVFGVKDIKSYVEFEEEVMLTNMSFIDVWIPSTKVLIEQKSINKNLNEKIKQSDGTFLTPFQQAQRYNASRPVSKHARWIVTCNFKEFYIYDMEHPGGEPEIVELKNLSKEYERLKFLVDIKSEHIKKEEEVSKKAGDLVGLLYNELKSQYQDINDEKALKSINILCVRLVFCLYAEDAELFNEKNQFVNYFGKVEISNFRDTLINFFKILDTKIEDRDKYANPELLKFPYVNGGLFAEEDIIIPQFNENIKKILIEDCGSFDWVDISPTIFGAIFESTLNPDTRRSGGMHYTSIENIHKVIDPLFLNDLNKEYDEIENISIAKTRNDKIDKFIEKISNLKFLDPAAGSGNFLTETYKCLRKIENKCLRLKIDSEKMASKGQMKLYAEDLKMPIKVSINQFYGIEINDFAVTVAKTALWIAEAQMLKETEEIINYNINFLPLKIYANIVEGNALKIDWKEVVDNADYIMGNPPFVGARLMDENQKKDINFIFGDDWKNAGDLDYVCCWYKKSLDYIKNTNCLCALVSTNSICQGSSVGNLWKPLFENNIEIIFAHRTFKWNSESNEKAAVFCVIVGFRYLSKNKIDKRIYDEGKLILAKNINGYLIDADNISINSLKNPISAVPVLLTGSQRLDNDEYMFNEEEMNSFIAKEPNSKNLFYRWYGADEFINNIKRYCLYIGNSQPSELKNMPLVLERINNVRNYRLNSSRKQTVKYADVPYKFYLEVIPKSDFLVIPVVSSENRRYIPIGYMKKENLCSNQLNLVPDATLYHFAILTSNVHMAWMRAVAGRLKSDYRYSKDIVYNNFPWPIDTTLKLTDKEKEFVKKGYPTIDKDIKKKIEDCGKAILDARNNYKDSTLADLYDELTMPSDLRKAHQENNAMICKAYGFTKEETNKESACVAKLFELYKMLVIN